MVSCKGISSESNNLFSQWSMIIMNAIKLRKMPIFCLAPLKEQYHFSFFKMRCKKFHTNGFFVKGVAVSTKKNENSTEKDDFSNKKINQI